MRSDPRSLVRLLTPTTRRHLEAAVGAASLARHGEVTVDHLLVALLAEPDGDAAALLDPAEREACRREAERALARLRTSEGRPALSPRLLTWIEEAWLVASVGWRDPLVRSGALLLAAIEGRVAALDDRSALAAIPVERVRAARAEALARTAEAAEVRASSSSRDADAGSAPAEGGALARFTTSFTAKARAGALDPVIGRERPIERVIDVLCRRRKNNPVLVGEPGVGKTAIVEGLALAIVRGEVPEALRGVELLGLEMGLLEAGASVKGELEARLTAVLREVKASPTPIVLFIDEAHTLVGAQPSGGTDAANLLKPALARGELRTIAATTFREHKKYFEKDPALERRFERVVIDEPSEEAAIAMLRGLAPRYEASHGVLVREEAIEAAVRLSHRYVSGRQLPDKCIDLLDTAAARVRVSQAARPLALATIDALIGTRQAERERLVRDRLDGKASPEAIARVSDEIASAERQRTELEARWRAQRDALERLLGARRALDEARTAGVADAERRAREIEVHAAREAFDAACGDAPMVSAEVDAAAVAATLESATGIPVGALKRDRTATLRTLEHELGARVLGQPAALASIAAGLRIAQAGLRRTDAPLGVFLLVGPSGVGKTETAHALADLLFGGERFLTTVNLSEYQEKHTVSRLVGSPPGYVGYGEGGKLTEAVRQRPHSVVLLDECEKADREVMNLFYQAFDRGALADGEGRAIDFRSTVLLLTSNLASERIAQLAAAGVTDAERIAHEIRPVLSAHFSPALLARMTVVPYLPIDEATSLAIADGELARVAERAHRTHGVSLRFGASVRERLVALCRASDAGVRNLRAVLEQHVLAPLALELLTGEAPSALNVDLDERGLVLSRGGR